VEKIKITRKEIDELYDIEEDTANPVTPEAIAQANRKDMNFTFEEYTEVYDKKEVEEDAT